MENSTHCTSPTSNLPTDVDSSSSSSSLCLAPGGEFPRGLQLHRGGPDLPGVLGQRPVVRRAARYHMQGRAQELPRQVRQETSFTDTAESSKRLLTSSIIISD